MEKTKKKSWLRLLVPGFIFQSVVIGGGYGTGAEISQYFHVNGFVGGLMGMGITLIIWAVLCAATFEFTRVFKTYDYQSMMSKLLGKASFLYELAYIALMLLVLGVVVDSAGSMIQSLVGITPWFGKLLLAAGAIILVIKGTQAIEKVLTIWSYVLYAVYIVFMVCCLTKFGGEIANQFAAMEVGANWAKDGFTYAFYNLGCVPLLLYTVRECDSRKEAVVSGLLAGAIGVIPAALLLVVLVGVPASLGASVPVTVVFEQLNMPWLYWIFEIVLMGTLIETATGFIKALDDRVHNSIAKAGKTAPKWLHGVLAVVLAIAGIGVAQFGLVAIIAQGYNAMNWVFMLIFALPMVTLGIYTIAKADKKA